MTHPNFKTTSFSKNFYFFSLLISEFQFFIQTFIETTLDKSLDIATIIQDNWILEEARHKIDA